MSAIYTEDLTKVFQISKKDPGVMGAVKALFRPRYEEKVAVDSVTFSIEPGEMVGYIGVNGAGKSTTIKMLTGVLEPTAGVVKVLGRDPHRERVANAREIGVVFGQRSQLWWDLALIESLNMVAQIYDVPRDRYQQLLEQFDKTLEIKSLFNVPIRQMSLGQKMRAELVATLIHEPEVVYLDEPTIGLDVLVKDHIREFIKQQNEERGTTVLLTTHDLGDIEELCKRVIIIDAGKLIYDGPLSTIKARFGTYRTLTLEMAHPSNGFKLPEGAEITQQDRNKLVIRFNRTRITASQLAAQMMSQIEVSDFSLAEPDLSSIVKQIYGGALREEVVV